MRQFVSSAEPGKDGLLLIEGKDFHYIRQVLRFSVGDMLKVSCPSGNAVNTTICSINEKSKTLVLQVCDIEDAVSSDVVGETRKTEFWLFQFIPKPQKMDLIIRQAVECGVSVIVPIIGEYTQSGTEKTLLSSRSERIQKIVKEARQQSGSNINTKVLEPLRLKDALPLLEYDKDTMVAFALYEKTQGTCSMASIVDSMQEIKRAAIAVGCEGGISPKEIEELKKEGFQPVHFETNILRCETAAIYGMAVLQSLIMKS